MIAQKQSGSLGSEQVIEGLPVGVLIVWPSGQYSILNNAAEQVLGVSRHDEGVPHIDDLFGEQTIVDRVKEALDQNRSVSVVRGLRGGRVVRVQIEPDHANHFALVVVSHLADPSVASRIRNLDLSSDQLEIVAQGLAHELRNPLAAVRGAAQLIRRHITSTGDGELLSVITDEVDRMNRILERFIRMTVWSEVLTEPHDINELALAVVRSQEPLRAAQDIQIRIMLDTSLPKIVMDADGIHQALLNVLNNAYKHVPRGGRVEVTTGIDLSAKIRTNSGSARLAYVRVDNEIADGVTTDYERMFTPFYTTREDGVGLGLPLVLRIVQAHQGTVGVEKGLLGGPRVTLYLPMITN